MYPSQPLENYQQGNNFEKRTSGDIKKLDEFFRGLATLPFFTRLNKI
ncbi:conserved hypothetical protein [delta proteobacterium NaphS2]|nr:conserved hypothetical protein [delta proteobacterium NaphS2]